LKPKKPIDKEFLSLEPSKNPYPIIENKIKK